MGGRAQREGETEIEGKRNSPQFDSPPPLIRFDPNPDSVPLQAILKTNKWRETYGVKDLAQSDLVTKFADKARVLNHRDITGRPVLYVPAKNHSSERDIDELTKFIVFCLVSGPFFSSATWPVTCRDSVGGSGSGD